MKTNRTRLFCALLSCLLLLGLLPSGMLPVGAAGDETQLAIPGLDGGYTTATLVDYTTVGAVDGGSAGFASYTQGTGYTVTGGGVIYTSAGQNISAWLGAAGILIAFDATESTGNQLFYTRLLMSESAVRVDNGNKGYVQFLSSPQANEGFSSLCYVNTDGTWAEQTVTQYNATLTAGTKGYVYIPMESYLYYGASAMGVSADKKCVGFDEGMAMLSNEQIWKFGIHTGGSATGCVFEKAEFVYPEQVVDDSMPAVLPGGANVDKARLWVDWDVAGVDNASVADGYCEVTGKDQQAWTHYGVDTTAWKGASGLMFYIDASGVTANVDFLLELLTNTGRPKGEGTVGNAQLKTAPTIWRSEGDGGPLQVGETSYAYYYNAQSGGWNEFSVSYPSYYLGAGVNYSGWYYVPLDSFWYYGGSGNGYDIADTGILSFSEFMEHFENQTLWKISMKSNTPGMRFGDVYFVYEDPESADLECGTAPLFGSMGINGSPEGSAAGTVSGNAVTVTGMANNNGNSRVWLNGLAQTDLSAASGLRFWVDASKMGEDGLLQLRIRLRAGVGVDKVTDVYAGGKGGYATLSGGMPQYVCRADNSVAYWYDENGEAHALRVADTVATDANGDVFEALPAGYAGYVYIPFDSFWMSCGSFGNLNCNIPFADAMAKYPIDLITICSTVKGSEGEGVTYSDFELVYADLAMEGASITLTNNLNLNVYASLPQGAEAPGMTFMVGAKTVKAEGELQEDGRYRFTCTSLLPQTVVDTVYATLSATVGGATVTQQVQYSIQEYCVNMLAREDSSAELKTLLVDLLYYAEAAQRYAGYKTDSPATAVLTDEQKALRSPDATGGISAESGLSGDAAEGYGWLTAALRLENTLAVKLRFEAASTEGLTAEVTINGRTVTFTEFAEEDGSYLIYFNNIGADEYDAEITAILRQNGEQIGQTLTYSVAAYIGEAVKNAEASEELTELLRSVYSYGTSAKAYAAAQ